MKLIEVNNFNELWTDDDGKIVEIDSKCGDAKLGKIKIGKREFPNTLYWKGLKDIKEFYPIEFVEYGNKRFNMYYEKETAYVLDKNNDIAVKYKAGDILYLIQLIHEETNSKSVEAI